MTAYRFEPLTRSHDRAGFQCGAAVLDRYLRDFARKDAERGVAAPYVMVEEAAPHVIVGYYTLSAFVVGLSDLPPKLASKMPRYPDLPAILIGRLARNIEFKGRGVGELLLVDALKRALVHSKQIAAMAVVADAKDDAALAFYLRFGFARLGDSASRVFIPMGTIEQLG